MYWYKNTSRMGPAIWILDQHPPTSNGWAIGHTRKITGGDGEEDNTSSIACVFELQFAPCQLASDVKRAGMRPLYWQVTKRWPLGKSNLEDDRSASHGITSHVCAGFFQGCEAAANP